MAKTKLKGEERGDEWWVTFPLGVGGLRSEKGGWSGLRIEEEKGKDVSQGVGVPPSPAKFCFQSSIVISYSENFNIHRTNGDLRSQTADQSVSSLINFSSSSH